MIMRLPIAPAVPVVLATVLSASAVRATAQTRAPAIGLGPVAPRQPAFTRDRRYLLCHDASGVSTPYDLTVGAASVESQNTVE
ncbi:MAG TPA: hypothetical protein VKE51_29460 [Vicinamibacterales bacterium]|nr:hypothetical protein [Vicinamibacterales bacterium]